MNAEHRRTAALAAGFLALLLILAWQAGLLKSSGGSAGAAQLYAAEKRLAAAKSLHRESELRLQAAQDAKEWCWSFDAKGTSPRSEIQQALNRLAKRAGLEATVNNGAERTVSGCEYLNQADFSLQVVGCGAPELQKLLDLIDEQKPLLSVTELSLIRNDGKAASAGEIGLRLGIRAIIMNGKSNAVFNPAENKPARNARTLK
ncbi:MAG: hypothetical protein RL095_3613 [Verrucomicrobiota bacterium]|jgi:hypothetical protein